MIFDTHSHCYWHSLEPRIEDIVMNMQKNLVIQSTQIGCDIDTSTQAITLAKRFPWVFYATVGFHPESSQDNYEWRDKKTNTIEVFEKLIQDNRDVVVAVGECGFDYHYLDGTDGGNIAIDKGNLSSKAVEQIENQKYWWLTQWQLAKRYNLPLVIHTRDARDETLSFMREHDIDRCVMHCFSEDWYFARELLEFSDEIYFSFSGILTYKKSEKIQEAAKHIPLDRILVETDAPFLAPQPVRGQVNEPSYTRYNLEKLAELRWVRVEDIEDVIYENSLRFYGIKQ